MITYLAALLAGLACMFAFAPYGWWPIQIVGMALVFHLIRRETTVKRSFLIGWVYGFGWAVGGVHWLYTAMHRFGELPAPLAALAVGLMGLLLGVFAAIGLASATWLRRRWATTDAVFLIWLLPACWALSEWLRGWVLTGLPWVVSGYAHSNSPLAGYAAIIGVYGIGLLAALCATGIAMLPLKKWSVVLPLALFAGGWGLQQIDWTDSHGQPISVRLLQGNIAQDIKFSATHLDDSLTLYARMIEAAPADLIVIPETALPLFAHQLPDDYLPRLNRFAQQSNSHLILGIPVADSPTRYTNSVIGMAPNASAEQSAYRYDKHHLVPFGEYIPTGLRWFVQMMQIPLGDFTAGGALQAPFGVRDQWIMPNICYEDLFGEQIATQIAARHFAGQSDTSILLNVSNMAWYGESSAIPQHLQISQMRALETGRPMLRSTNNGATVVISPHGELLAQLPFYSQGALATRVQGMTGLTPYIVLGNWLVVTLALLMLAASWFFSRKNPGKRNKRT
ncbi:MAG: apolipoprotein N-acyltransferase [Pseudomonadota bacterium]